MSAGGSPYLGYDAHEKPVVDQAYSYSQMGGWTEPSSGMNGNNFGGDVKGDAVPMNSAVAYPVQQQNGFVTRSRSGTASAYAPPWYTPDVVHLGDHTSFVTRFLFARVQKWPMLRSILSEKDSRRILYFMAYVIDREKREREACLACLPMLILPSPASTSPSCSVRRSTASRPAPWDCSATASTCSSTVWPSSSDSAPPS